MKIAVRHELKDTIKVLKIILFRHFSAPIVKNDKWSCHLFPHFPNGFSFDFGGSEFCDTNHFYPDCDPQVVVALVKRS